MHSLIVGGTRGLGRELARLFSEEGRIVSVIGKRAPSEADAGLRGVDFWQADVTRGEALPGVLADIIRRHGKWNYAVFLQRFKGDSDKWTGEIETSLTATKKLIELLAENSAGEGDKGIVVVSSIADQFISAGQPAGYHVAKAGLYQLACYYAVVLGPKGIRVNCVSPCTIVKDENRDFYLKNAALRNVFGKTIPLGRMGSSLESAHVIAFLCSPKASFVTGQRIAVDGGVSLVSQESLARSLTGV
jgi:NAD(P)-dependent dehydrogenase (short-subunit alcohol dehydrogenase family)